VLIVADVSSSTGSGQEQDDFWRVRHVSRHASEEPPAPPSTLAEDLAEVSPDSATAIFDAVAPADAETEAEAVPAFPEPEAAEPEAAAVPTEPEPQAEASWTQPEPEAAAAPAEAETALADAQTALMATELAATEETDPAFEEDATFAAEPMPIPETDNIDSSDVRSDPTAADLALSPAVDHGDPSFVQRGAVEDEPLVRRGVVQVSVLGTVVLAVVVTGVVAAFSLSGNGPEQPKAVQPATPPSPAAALPDEQVSARPSRSPTGHGTPATSRLSRQHQPSPGRTRGINSPSSQKPPAPSPPPSPSDTCFKTIGVFKFPCN
jgi:hypothetical protein